MSTASSLLTTKFFIPTLRLVVVARPRLLTLLNGGLDKKLLLVSAPAGFGKTTLVAAWIEDLRLNRAAPKRVDVAWLSLDGNDNEPERFFTYMVAALQSVAPAIGTAALLLLQAAPTTPLEQLLTLLINDLSPLDSQLLLVLDDYHVITAQPIHDALIFLLEHLPPTLHLLLTTRMDPPLPLARWRVRRELVEVRARELRFTAVEAAQFLQQTLPITLTQADVAALEERTEGWIAGLQLAALSLTEHTEPRDFIQSFTGSHAYIVDYLAEEVLQRQPVEIENFLLQTSLLDRLCAPLCFALTQQPDSETILARLERANLFLIPLDNERRWYRYHHLFAEVLRNRLQHRRSAEIGALHGRAADWYEQNGFVNEAITHALAATDYPTVLRLLEEIFVLSVNEGKVPNLVRWLNQLPEAQLRTSPRLCLASAWSLLWWSSAGERARSWDTIAAWLQTAEQTLVADAPQTAAVRAEILMVRANVASIRDDFAATLDLAQQALVALPLASPWRGLMTMFLGEAHLMMGNAVIAEKTLATAVAMSPRQGANDIWMLTTSHWGTATVACGRLTAASARYRQVVDEADRRPPPVRRAVHAMGGLAQILCERNQLAAAEHWAQRGLAMIAQGGGSLRGMLVTHVPLARVQQAQGNGTAALATLDQLAQLAQKEHVHLLTQAWIAAQRTRICLMQGDLSAASQWVAVCGLHPEDTASGAALPILREMEYTTLARCYIRNGEARLVLPLLDRLLDAALGSGRTNSVIEIHILQALAYQMLADKPQALAALADALTLAAPEGYVRLFVDEGRALRLLLDDFRLIKPIALLAAYVDTLCAAFGIIRSTPAIAPPLPPRAEKAKIIKLVEPLSAREIEVLRLVSNGLSNSEIAKQIIVTVGTVKRHLNNIFGKLGVGSRTQAIVRARELDLL